MPTGPRLVCLAVVSVLAVFLVACGGDDGGDDADTRDARALLSKAFSRSPDSGEVRLRVRVDLDGMEELDEPIALTVTGAFESRGEAHLPEADWRLAVNAAGLPFRGRLKLTDDKAYLEFQDDAYEVGSLRDISGDSDEGGDGELLTGIDLDPETWLDDPELEDGQEIGGDPTRKVTGSVDVEQVVRDLLGILRSPEVKRELGPQAELFDPPELSEEDYDKLRDAIEELTFEANVDGNEYLRRLLIKARFDVPSDAGAGDLEGGDLSVDYVAEKVRADVEVRPPRNPQPLGELLRGFGLNFNFGPTERQ